MLEASREAFFKKVAEGGPLPEGVGLDLWYYQLRDQQWRDCDERPSKDGGWLRDFDALYLFGTIGTEAILRGNGQVWVRPDEHWDDANAAVAEWRPADEHERRVGRIAHTSLHWSKPDSVLVVNVSLDPRHLAIVQAEYGVGFTFDREHRLRVVEVSEALTGP